MREVGGEARGWKRGPGAKTAARCQKALGRAGAKLFVTAPDAQGRCSGAVLACAIAVCLVTESVCRARQLGEALAPRGEELLGLID